MVEYQGQIGPPRLETPPPKGLRRGTVLGDLFLQIPELRRNRHKWMRVAEFETQQGANSAMQKIKRYETGCEWASRRVGYGSALWGRYLG